MNKIKQILSVFLIIFLAGLGYLYAEPRILQAASDTDTSVATLVVSSEISISDGADITMSGLDMTNSTSTGQTSWIVTTNDEAGWKLEVEADRVNALYSADIGEEFADYSEAVGGTPESWMSDDGEFEFGFGVHATATDVFGALDWGSGDNCGTGASIDSNQHYLGFDGINKIQVATKAATTTVSGQEIIFCVAAVQSNVFAPSGTYKATTTATATTL